MLLELKSAVGFGSNFIKFFAFFFDDDEDDELDEDEEFFLFPDDDFNFLDPVTTNVTYEVMLR